VFQILVSKEHGIIRGRREQVDSRVFIYNPLD
jgi:hypothetical protein